MFRLLAGEGVLREALRLRKGEGVRRGDNDLLDEENLCEDGRRGEVWVDSLEQGLPLRQIARSDSLIVASIRTATEAKG